MPEIVEKEAKAVVVYALCRIASCLLNSRSLW